MPNKTEEACMIRLWYTMRGWKMDKNGHMTKRVGKRGCMIDHRRRITKDSVINEVKLHGSWVQGGREPIKTFVKMIENTEDGNTRAES